MEAGSVPEGSSEEPLQPPPAPRQRWRLVVARGSDAPASNQRELAEAWGATLASSDLPVAWSDPARTRPRISFGAPLPVDVAAEGELVDLFLTERLPAWRVREGLVSRLPPGWRLVDLFDVWLAGPALAGQVAAADHRVTLAGDVEAAAIARAATSLLQAESLPRERVKGGGTVCYDLRPLLVDISVLEAGPPVVIRARTRIHPELGTGRPEELVAALASAATTELPIASIVRERLVLADELVELDDAI